MTAAEEIPLVCFIEDLVRILGTSRRTITRLRSARVFPIRELPSLDRRPRWSRQDVELYLANHSRASLRRVG